MKSLVFTTFFSRVAFYYFTTNKNGQNPKKSLVFGSGHHNCSNFFACDLTRTLHIYLIKIPFRSYWFEDDFTRFIYLFELTKNFFFCLFSKYGKSTALVMKNHSEQIHKVLLSEMYRLDKLFLTFWKKMIFNVSDSTFFNKIIKLFQSEKKWVSMAYLSLP